MNVYMTITLKDSNININKKTNNIMRQMQTNNMILTRALTRDTNITTFYNIT